MFTAANQINKRRYICKGITAKIVTKLPVFQSFLENVCPNAVVLLIPYIPCSFSVCGIFTYFLNLWSHNFKLNIKFTK